MQEFCAGWLAKSLQSKGALGNYSHVRMHGSTVGLITLLAGDHWNIGGAVGHRHATPTTEHDIVHICHH